MTTKDWIGVANDHKRIILVHLAYLVMYIRAWKYTH